MLDRSFIAKGSVVSVYMADDEKNTVEEIIKLPKLRDVNDNSDLDPRKMLLHEQDSKMLLLDKNQDKSVFYMDLEKAKVIRDLKADGINTIKDIAPLTKMSEFTTNPCFVGLNERNLFKFDPRVKDPNVAAVESKIYNTNNKFTCITTTNLPDESFAAANALGEIRLYKQMGQNAKNSIPGLGAPITSLDSSKDGKWLLATTKTYLVLLPTFSAAAPNGYTHALGKNKYVPYRLTISPEDMRKYNVKEINFTAAKFNDTKDGIERFIVSSTGNLVITWSYKKITAGHKEQYKIKQMDDNVLGAEFRYSKTDSILLTLAQELRVQKTKYII